MLLFPPDCFQNWCYSSTKKRVLTHLLWKTFVLSATCPQYQNYWNGWQSLYWNHIFVRHLTGTLCSRLVQPRSLDRDGAVQDSRRHYWSGRRQSHYCPRQSWHFSCVWCRWSRNPYPAARGRVRHHWHLQKLDHVLPDRMFSYSSCRLIVIIYCWRSSRRTPRIGPWATFVYGVSCSDRKTWRQVYTKLEVPAKSWLASLQQCVAVLHTWFSQNALLHDTDTDMDKSGATYFGTRQRLRVSKLPVSSSLAALQPRSTNWKFWAWFGTVLWHLTSIYRTQSGTAISTYVHFVTFGRLYNPGRCKHDGIHAVNKAGKQIWWQYSPLSNAA